MVADDEVFDASVSAVFWSAYQFVVRGGYLSCRVLGDVTYEYMAHEHEVLPVEPPGNGTLTSLFHIRGAVPGSVALQLTS